MEEASPNSDPPQPADPDPNASLVANPLQSHLGTYAVIRPLAADRTFLGEQAGRRVVLKRVDTDCLTGPGLRRLNPMVRDRLARVQELADLRVAHLFGVELFDDRAYLVWEYVDGVPIDKAMRDCDSPESMILLVRELLLAVQSLHTHGIVHGALDSGNVLVDRLGGIRLIDVSPLLFDDPRHDEAAVLRLLNRALASSGPISAPRGGWRSTWIDWIERAENQRRPLEWLRISLTSSSEPTTDEADVHSLAAERANRRRSRVGAILLIAIGVLIAVTVALVARGS